MFAEGNSKLILTFVAGSGRRGLVMKLTQVSDHDMSQARLTNNGHKFEYFQNLQAFNKTKVVLQIYRMPWENNIISKLCPNFHCIYNL